MSKHHACESLHVIYLEWQLQRSPQYFHPQVGTRLSTPWPWDQTCEYQDLQSPFCAAKIDSPIRALNDQDQVLKIAMLEKDLNKMLAGNPLPMWSLPRETQEFLELRGLADLRAAGADPFPQPPPLCDNFQQQS